MEEFNNRPIISPIIWEAAMNDFDSIFFIDEYDSMSLPGIT